MFPPCLKLASTRPVKVGEVVEIGRRGILWANPPKCIVVQTTQVERREALNVRRLEDGDEVVYIVNGQALVYDRRVVERVEKFVVEPLAKGLEPVHKGALFIGPPGTGKSMLCELLPQIYGLKVSRIDATIQSKYVGETERAIARAFEEAERARPAAIVAHDVDWLFAAREFSEVRSFTGRYEFSLFNTVVNRLDRARGIIMLANTNASESILDQAFVRGGRLGRPIYLPPPTVRQMALIVKYSEDPTILKAVEILRGEVEKYARSAVAAGFTHADWVDWLKSVAIAEKVIPIEPSRAGQGYRRAPPVLDDYGLELRGELTWGRHVVNVHLPEYPQDLQPRDLVPLNFLVTLLLLRRKGLPVFVLIEKLRLREAEYAVQTMRGALVVTREDLLEELSLSPVHFGEYVIACPLPWSEVPSRLKPYYKLTRVGLKSEQLPQILSIAFELSSGRRADYQLMVKLTSKFKVTTSSSVRAMVYGVSLALSSRFEHEEDFVNAIEK